MIRRILAALLAVLFITGCTEIDVAGPVEEVPVDVDAKAIDIAPEPPSEGVSPGRLVDGYLQALADPEGGYQVAREYLTPEASAEWEPTTAVIYRGSIDGDDTGARLAGHRIGELDEIGRYTATHEEFTHDFDVVLHDGEYRIANPPDGLLLSPYLFSRYYRRVALYFMSLGGSNVVPDPIHVPESLVTPRVVVEGLLAGPSPHMQRSVESEIPDGVTLGQGGATTDSAGVVTVDFSGLSPLMNDDARRRLGAQLMWSLTAVPRVAGLVVTSNGLPFSLPGANANGVLELSGLQGYQVLSRVSTSDLFGIRYGIAGRLAGPSVFERLPGVARALGDLAVSIDGTTAALLDETRSQLSIGPIAGDIAPVDTGLINMSTPQFALGSVWVLGDDAEGKQHLFTIDRNRNVHSVRLDVGVNQRVRAFAVSPTQSRVALILENQEGTRLAMSSILTGGGALGETHVLPVSALNGALLTDFNAVTWYAETSVAVVATGGTGSRSVFTVQLDGSLLEEIGPIFGEIEELAGMSRLGGGSLAVRTDTGLVWRYEARTRWTRVAENITAIAFAA